MKADGEIVYCSEQSNPEIFKAALLSLGALGVIINVTIQCEPAFHLHEYVEAATLDEVRCLCFPKVQVRGRLPSISLCFPWLGLILVVHGLIVLFRFSLFWFSVFSFSFLVIVCLNL